MLSLVGKLAALYAQSTSDSVVLQSVNDIETLTNGISRKIWQKIMILDDDLKPEPDNQQRELKSEGPSTSLVNEQVAVAPTANRPLSGDQRLPVSEPKR
jgi:hypothetical protein